MKRLIAATIAILLFAGGAAVGQSVQRFSDVPTDHYAHGAIEWAARNGITSGYGDGTFRPESPMTRAQMMVYLMRYHDSLGDPLDEPDERVTPTTTQYVPPTTAPPTTTVPPDAGAFDNRSACEAQGHAWLSYHPQSPYRPMYWTGWCVVAQDADHILLGFPNALHVVEPEKSCTWRLNGKVFSGSTPEEFDHSRYDATAETPWCNVIHVCNVRGPSLRPPYSDDNPVRVDGQWKLHYYQINEAYQYAPAHTGSMGWWKRTDPDIQHVVAIGDPIWTDTETLNAARLSDTVETRWPRPVINCPIR